MPECGAECPDVEVCCTLKAGHKGEHVYRCNTFVARWRDKKGKK